MADFYQIPLENKNDKDYLKWEKLNFILRRIFDSINNVDGRNGPIEYKNDLDLDGNAIQNGPVQSKVEDTDFVTKSYFRSSEFGKMVVALLSSSGKTPLSITQSPGTPASGGGGGGGTSDHALLTHLSYATAGHTGFVPATRTISTTAPLSGGGDLSADRTLAIAAATGATNGYLTAADWTTFNSKVPPTRTISTTSPLTGGGDLSADRTLGINVSLIDHGSLAGLTDDDHTQYILVTGSRAFTGLIRPAVQTVNPAGAAIAIDAANGNHVRSTIDQSCTVSAPSNPVDGARLTLELIQNGTGGWTVAFDAVFVVASNWTMPVPTIVANKRSIIHTVYSSSLGKWIITGFLQEL